MGYKFKSLVGVRVPLISYLHLVLETKKATDQKMAVMIKGFSNSSMISDVAELKHFDIARMPAMLKYDSLRKDSLLRVI